jgi:hypothetical protein
MVEMVFSFRASRDCGQHKRQMHKKTIAKPDLAMIKAPFFPNAVGVVYVIVHLPAM